MPRINPGIVYDVSYRCRDLGYGIEEGIITAYWTGHVDAWGKLTIVPVDGTPTIYLFQDEIMDAVKVA